MNNKTLSVLSDMFTTNMNVHHQTRHRLHRLHVTAARTNMIKPSFKHEGIQIWNNLKQNYSNQTNSRTFKKQLKNKYLNEYIN